MRQQGNELVEVTLDEWRSYYGTVVDTDSNSHCGVVVLRLIGAVIEQ